MSNGFFLNAKILPLEINAVVFCYILAEIDFFYVMRHNIY